jgi:hypothetical protein
MVRFVLMKYHGQGRWLQPGKLKYGSRDGDYLHSRTNTKGRGSKSLATAGRPSVVVSPSSYGKFPSQDAWSIPYRVAFESSKLKGLFLTEQKRAGQGNDEPQTREVRTGPRK